MSPSRRDELPSSSRYEILVKIASGGMATVYVGRLSSARGFRRLVAIKRAHAHLLEESSFARMLKAEARVASQIHHPNSVAVQDVEELEGELLLIMDYVEGTALSNLFVASFQGELDLAPGVAVRIALDACAGLHAAHELTDEAGKRLGVVHRDVSPQNVLVGIDGMSRITDFGVAKWERDATTQTGSALTTTGALKGKISYMAPEYLERGELDARSDVFAMGVVVWEALANRRLFRATNEIETMKKIVAGRTPRLSSVRSGFGRDLDDVLARALERSPRARYQTVREFAEALEAGARTKGLISSHADVAAHVRALVGEELTLRRALIRGYASEGETPPRQSVAPMDGHAASTEGSGSDQHSITVSFSDDFDARDIRPEVSTLAGSGVSSRQLQARAGGARVDASRRKTAWRWAAVSTASLLGLALFAANLARSMPEHAREAVPASPPSADTFAPPTPSAEADASSTPSAMSERPSAGALAPAAAPGSAPSRPNTRSTAKPSSPARTSSFATAEPVQDRAAPNPYVRP